MLVPMSWLKDYTDVDCDIMTYTDEMTMTGTKVEGHEELGKEVSNVVVGKILRIEKHPDADKLIVCQVDVGEEKIQIVTGAKNVNEGDIVPIALAGAELPGDIKIKKGKLRGIESNGMMCSVEELGFTTEDIPDAPEDGIYIFSEELPLGQDVKPYFGLGDLVVEYEITSNRPDCQSILGIAREAAITFDKPFKYPEITLKEEAEGKVEDLATIEIREPELCPRYAARIVKNVKIGPSPKWMRQRLLAAGLRPINNLVDITNFVMLEFGQPMHAFDLSALEGSKIVVRRAEDGEDFVTLDEEERKLDASMLVIADEKKAVAVAGIMGGENSKVRDDATTILFECANFDGTAVRLTSKKLGLRTDSSSKFEKGLDPNNVIPAIDRACQLLEGMGAGEVVPGIIDHYSIKREENKVEYCPDSINALLGTDISEDYMVEVFEKIGCSVDREKRIVSAPTFRHDISREADLAEEVVRFYGYNNIPMTLATGTATVGKKSFKQQLEEMMKTILEGCGLNEAMTYSFESPKVYDKLHVPAESSLRNAIKIKNPLGEDFSMMRTQTVNGMLNALATNFSRRVDHAYLYEIGKVYLPKELPLTELPDEREQLTLGLYGKDVDFFSTKGVVEMLYSQLGMDEDVIYEASKEKWLHPGRQAVMTINGKKLGVIGEVHPAVLDNYEIETRVYMVVIDIPTVIENANMERSYEALPKYPSVTRDLAMLVKEDVLVGQIDRVIKNYGGKFLVDVELFDVYQGEQIEKGFKSIAYKVTFRSKDKTLKDKEVNKQINKILFGLEKELKITLRQ